MRVMEIGPAFDDIVDHPIMGRERAVPAVPFSRFACKKRYYVAFAMARPDLS
jgi:hypothetical protein